MSKIIPLREAKPPARDDIINAVVELITQQGIAAVTSRKIAESAGLPLGSIQHHFGSKEQMLEAVLERCHQIFLILVNNEELLKGSLEERAAMFIALSWRHYRSDIYVATLEILIATRSHRNVVSLVQLTKQQAAAHNKRIREIFPECPLDDRALSEVMIASHCSLTGLTVEVILQPKLVNIGGYLRRIASALEMMLVD